MLSDVAEDGSRLSPSEEFPRKAKYRVICLGCAASSGEVQTHAEAARWREEHCREICLPDHVIIESTVLLPSGTLGRFF